MEIRNIENSFTELFSLLKRNEILSFCKTNEVYTTDELIVMHQHADNAMTTLLQGLQDVGQILSIAARCDKEVMHDLYNIGYFITAISNLTEALDKLRADAAYALGQLKQN